MEYCLRGSKQLCIRKNPVQCFFNIVGTILKRSNCYTMLFERLQTTLRKKMSVQFCLITLGTTLKKLKPYAMLSKRLQKTFHKKNSCPMLS